MFTNYSELKNRILKAWLLVLCLFLLFSCNKVPKIEGFDAAAWKKDIEGCFGDRAKLVPLLDEQRHELKMVEAPELKKLLGPPNAIEIMGRQQRYYIYWIQNPEKCADTTLKYQEVRIRVSALGKVTEVLF